MNYIGLNGIQHLLEKIKARSPTRVFGGRALTREALENDEAAEYSVATKTADHAADQVLFELDVEGLGLGAYSIMLRTKSSLSGANTKIMEISTFYTDGVIETALSAISVSASKFRNADTYQTIGFVVDFSGRNTPGKKLRIKAVLPKTEAAASVTVDYVMVSPSITAWTSIG